MKILVIGCGSIGQRHIQNLHEIGYDEIYGVDPNSNSRAKRQLKTLFKDISEINGINFDCIFVATPTALHNDGLKFAVNNNCHIFMEKPLIHNYNGLQVAIESMKDYNKVFFIGFMLRYHPLLKKIKDIIISNEYGDIFSARLEFGSYLPFWHPWEDYHISYAANKNFGGGVINTITHELDIIQYLFGLPKALFCYKDNFNELNIDVEEIAEAIFIYKSKIVSLHLDYLQKDYDRYLKILFKNGRLIWNWHENTIEIFPHKSPQKTIKLNQSFDINQLYLDEVKDFMNIVDGKKSNNLDFLHAIENTELMLMMHESGELGKIINREVIK